MANGEPDKDAPSRHLWVGLFGHYARLCEVNLQREWLHDRRNVQLFHEYLSDLYTALNSGVAQFDPLKECPVARDCQLYLDMALDGLQRVLDSSASPHHCVDAIYSAADHISRIVKLISKYQSSLSIYGDAVVRAVYRRALALPYDRIKSFAPPESQVKEAIRFAFGELERSLAPTSSDLDRCLASRAAVQKITLLRTVHPQAWSESMHRSLINLHRMISDGMSPSRMRDSIFYRLAFLQETADDKRYRRSALADLRCERIQYEAS